MRNWLDMAGFGGFLRLPEKGGITMRTVMTLVLMTLIGGYGAAQAQTMEEMEEVVEMEDATKDFLGLEWGAGIGIMGGFGGDAAVEKASIDANNFLRVDEEGNLRPQLFLEMHVFLWSPKAQNWRAYQRWKSAGPMARARTLKGRELLDPKTKEFLVPEPPLMGFGPFIALQSSDNEAIDAFSLGVMWGFRKDPEESTSLNIGIGLSFDPSVQVLGGGLREGKELPENEMAVRFKKEAQFGWALMTSFTF